ncbi:sulfatase family protein [Roseimaritima sediminicola]|uniref:sulfatase family protein n=1 Tax=Roseimaritima sediminicola TaxID=2662066 RepID=UPI001387583A|nr:sulfatase [Roseimaritima sediminicola]
MVGWQSGLRGVACVLVLSLGWLAGERTGAAAAEPDRPNILILLGDDIDRDSLGVWGGPVHTPHLERLAKEGMRLDRVYCNVAMCAPFRQELYSGRSVWRTRAMPNHSKSVEGTRSLPHYLRPLGYRVGLLGKQHIGPPSAYPFDRVGSLPGKKDSNAAAVRQARRYITEARTADQPFCLVVAAHDGHSPYTTGDPSAYDAQALPLPAGSVDTPQYRQRLIQHYAEVTNLDRLLGRLRAMLREEQLERNTLVLFCSEQGNAFPFSKWTCFDDGLATGVMVALPDVIPAGTQCDQLMWLADFAPTILQACGGEPSSDDFDGRSQWINLTGGDQTIHRYAFGAFTNCNIIDNRTRVFPIRSVRDAQYSLIWSPRHDEEITSNTTLTAALEYRRSGKVANARNVALSWALAAEQTSTDADDALVDRFFTRPEWALYDRQRDPEELINRFDDEELSEERKRLQDALRQWLTRWDDADPVATERGFRDRAGK